MSVRNTSSLCPECLRALPATLTTEGDEVWMARTCPDHGPARTLVWRGPPEYESWRRAGSGPSCCDPPANPDCPTACGLCAGHARTTCCVLLEVTARCDLECPVCFAGARRTTPEDPSIETIEGWYRRVLETAPGGNIQLSGGEPTVRDDLPEVIARGRALGLPFLQLNTNGLRLAAEDGYAERLAAAGLHTVFLQFDGVDDDVHRVLRGRPLAAVKDRAVELCARAGLGIVLVPTVVRGANLGQLGEILDFALERHPAVRGIHLQPLAYFGRYPVAPAQDERVTLPDVIRELAVQSKGRIRLEDFAPGDCEHALCSFGREYLHHEDGTLVALRRDGAAGCGCGPAAESTRPRVLRPADKAAHVARRWAAPPGGAGAQAATEDRWEEILRQIGSAAFSVSGMAFQDAWSVDLERLRHCYLHVMAADGRLVPFCAYNLTAADGHGLPGGRAEHSCVRSTQSRAAQAAQR